MVKSRTPRIDHQTVSDQKIIDLVLANPQEGFDALLDRFGGEIKGPLMERFGGGEEEKIESAVGEAIWKVCSKPEMYQESRGQLRSYIFRIAENILIDEYNRAWTFEAFPEGVEKRHAPEVVAEIEPKRRIARDALNDAIKRLPPLQRKIIRADLANNGESVSAKDLAHRFQTSPTSIYVSRNKARRKLMDRLTPLMKLLTRSKA